MILPGAPEVFAALDATWPAAEYRALGPFRLRRGEGGGKRVSAASAEGPATSGDIAAAENGMRAMGQVPLFALREGEDGLDAVLAGRGYGIVDPVTLYAAPTRSGPDPAPREITPALAALWAGGGIGPGRRAVMERVTGAKAVLALPGSGTPSAALFIARADGGAMLHALHVAPAARRQGLGRALTLAAIHWAAARGAPWTALAVTDANLPARALYASLGFHPVGRYWYRAVEG